MMVTNSDLHLHLPLVKTIMRRPMPARLALRITTRLRALQAHFEDIEEQRLALLRTYGEWGVDGQLVRREDGHVVLQDEAGFNAEWTALLAAEAEIPLGAPILIHEVPEDFQVSLTEMVALNSLGIIAEGE
jgi:hypothetical protein